MTTKTLTWRAKATVPRILGWESQARQYEQSGPPGITYFRGDLTDMEPIGKVYVDCLLHYGEDGTLDGILNHYPMDLPPFEKAGAFNVWVREDRRRTGIARRLFAEGCRRWLLDVTKQRWTEAGAAWINAIGAHR